MRRTLLRGIAFAGLIAFLVLWIVKPSYSADAVAQRLWESLLYRLAGSVVFVSLLLDLRFRVLRKPTWKHLLILLPCLAVCVNNLPILSLAWEDAYLTRSELIWLFFTDCLLVALFEELAFRGTLLLTLLEHRRASKKQIFWRVVLSSALFGAFHLINLLEGASFGATILQVGYSFLIGGMCGIVLLRTGNLVYCVLLHTVYNFCGGLLPTLGAGKWWDVPTVIFTAVLAVLVIALMVWMLLRTTPEEAALFYAPSTSKKRSDKENDEYEHHSN